METPCPSRRTPPIEWNRTRDRIEHLPQRIDAGLRKTSPQRRSAVEGEILYLKGVSTTASVLVRLHYSDGCAVPRQHACTREATDSRSDYNHGRCKIGRKHGPDGGDERKHRPC